MSKLWIIAFNVFKKNVKSVPFWMNIFLPIIIGVGSYAFASFKMNNTNQETVRIAIISEDHDFQNECLKQSNRNLEFELAKDEKKAQNLLAERKIDGYLTVISKEIHLYNSEILSQATQEVLQNTVNAVQVQVNAKKLNISPTELAKLNKIPKFLQTQIYFDEQGKLTNKKNDSGIRQVVNIVFLVLTMMFTFTYGPIIAQEIANEKGTRIMEMILSSVQAKTHFYGKILGMLMLIIVNFLVYLAMFVAFITMKVDQDMLKGIDFSEIFGGLFIWTIPFIILTIFLYMFLSAFLGSLISRLEDVPKAVQPLVFLGMLGFYPTIFLQDDPTNIILRVSSFIPFFSGFVIPSQIANGVATLPQILGSLVILIGTSIGLLIFSARLYKTNVLLYGDGGLIKSLKQSWKNSRKEL
ncbi:MAG: ABC transporter permease [Streptococcaceae bacterium]|jgi:ABC-2 type transport system permease protein|nr:ABC transporter permease [Streptococcaceae bacterium]